MAKRKSINKRLSRYNRSSIGSGFLDPNSEVLGEEEPFWWNNLTNNANQSLFKYNVANQTSKYLDSDSQAEVSDATNGWWNILDSTDSGVFNNLPTVQKNKQSDTVQRSTKAAISDSDEEDSSLPPRKRKITIRGKSRRSKSNPFLKAFIDSENLKLSKSIQDTIVAKTTNDTSVINKSLKESDFKEDYTSKNDNVNVTASTDQSHTTDKILKSKPQVFRKRYEKEKENVFEDLLRSAEGKHNETEATEIVPINSSDKLVERNKISEGNFSKRSITNPRISKQDDDYIYYEHSDSSFEIQSDHVDKDLPKESAITENHMNQTVSSTYFSKGADNSHINNKTTRSPENNDKNEKLFKHISHIHTLSNNSINQSHIHSRINNSESSFNIIDQKNVNKEDAMQESNIKDIISRSLPMNKTLTNPANASFKHRKTDLKIDSTNIKTSFEHSSNTINDSKHNVTKNFANECLTNNNTNDSLKQINKINSHSTAIPKKNLLKFQSNNNEQLKVQLSTSLHKGINAHGTDNLNEKSFSKSNGGTEREEVDMGPSISEQVSKGITNIVINNNSDEIDENDQLCHKTMNAINFDRQKRINEYFRPTSSKLTFPIKIKKLENMKLIKKTKENEELKKRLEQKKQKLDDLNKIPFVTQSTGRELKERIQKLENEETKKLPIKAKVHPAYLINGKRYKRPKLPRPQFWVTDRLYRHLWKIMEPKYKLLTRVESEKFVKRLSKSVSIIIKSKKYEDYKDELDYLMSNMARLGIIHTRNDFYDFSYEFLPYDFRIKVVPMIMPGNIKNVPYDPKKLHEPLIVE